jgi:hypothetical protein
MVSATLNQDIKELAQLALKQPMQFTVSQQQRLADIASLRLTQYLVRLPDKEDAVKGMVVKRKTDGAVVSADQEKKDSDISGEEGESDEEGEDDMDEDMEESGEDNEQGEDEIDEDASYH